jgi:hypothetical protein
MDELLRLIDRYMASRRSSNLIAQPEEQEMLRGMEVTLTDDKQDNALASDRQHEKRRDEATSALESSRACAENGSKLSDVAQVQVLVWKALLLSIVPCET